MNYLTPTKKPTGYSTDRVGRRKRVYDTPATPYQRLTAAGVLNPAQEAELAARKAALKPAAIAAQINAIQQELTRAAGLKTRHLEEQTRPQLPNPAGIRVRAS